MAREFAFAFVVQAGELCDQALEGTLGDDGLAAARAGEADFFFARSLEQRALEGIAAFTVRTRHRFVVGGGECGQLAFVELGQGRRTATGIFSSVTASSGISRAGSKTDSVPSPSQTGHAPAGLLKEKWRGVISAKR